MAQNIYDDAEFFARYAGLPRSRHGLDSAPEWTALASLLPPPAGRRVVDLGCGYGWFSRWAADQGASGVLGIDLSERMLARAASFGAHERIVYERQDLDELTLPTSSFGLAFSSLTLHYLDDLGRFLTTVAAALVPGGSLVCSVEHPLYTAPTEPGFVSADGGTMVWPLDRYLDEGPRTTDWLAPGVVKQHRTIETYVRSIRRAGLVLDELVEWGPTIEQLATHPEWAGERDRPAFLLLAARAPG